MSTAIRCCKSLLEFGHMLLITVVLTAAGPTYSGSLHSASENQVVVMVGTELLTFQVTKDTAVTLNGKTVKPTELKSADSMTVESEKGDDGAVRAMSIKATRKT